MKTRRIVIFGSGQIAELADFYFTNDSAYEVAAFTVDQAFFSQGEFRGRPVVPFERVAEEFPPQDFDFFVAIGYTKLNQLRPEKVAAARAKGYRLVSYLSSRATVFAGFELQENCFILEDNTIQPFARVGRNVTLWSGNHIGHHSRIADHCFLASHIVVSGGVDIGEACFLGVNATLRDHIRVGERCVIGAGALILADAAPDGVYLGNATERSKVPSSRLRKI